MTTESNPSAGIDWSLTTWEGSRRAQLRRWAEMPLENIVAALEEMEGLNSLLNAPTQAIDSPNHGSESLMTNEHVPLQTYQDSLPSYTDEYLRSLTAVDLIELMTRDEDRVPRNVIEACAARADEFLPIFEQMLEDPRFWSEEEIPLGAWWLKLHAILIQGLMPTLRAGEILARTMRRLAETDDEDFAGWCAGYWPVLFINKPASTSNHLRTIAEDATLGWYARCNAFEVVLALAHRESPAALETALDWVAEHAGAPSASAQDANWQAELAGELLNFPRERHRALLETLERGQHGFIRAYSRSEITAAFERGTDLPSRMGFADPWEFYAPPQIEARQVRWASEALSEDEPFEFPEEHRFHRDFIERPFVKNIPKTGRNDPCHCGSGKKYKKCHLAIDNL